MGPNGEWRGTTIKSCLDPTLTLRHTWHTRLVGLVNILSDGIGDAFPVGTRAKLRDGEVCDFPAGPSEDRRAGEGTCLQKAARRSLWLTDAYFIGTTSYIHALRAAAKDHVDVRLLVPAASDIRLIGPLSRAMYRPLLEAGVRVFEWNGPMLHAKTAVAGATLSQKAPLFYLSAFVASFRSENDHSAVASGTDRAAPDRI